MGDLAASIFLGLLFSIQVAQATLTYIDAFRSLRDTNHWVWPVPDAPRSYISSTFGPRAKISCGGCYDFHRGIDIHATVGESIVSIAPGVVEALRNFTGGGLTVIVRHQFSEPVTLHPNLPSFDQFFSLYMHLSEWTVVENQIVGAGELVGRAGLTGSTVSPHLHIEVRVATWCSQESSCNSFGFDPHVHPLLAMEAEVSSISFNVVQSLNSTQAAVVRIETDDVNPDLNRYFVQVTDGEVSRRSHILDLNLRSGFDASSTEALDTPDTSKPYLSPLSFGYTSSTWSIDVVIPSDWVGSLQPTEIVVLSLTDIWGVERNVTVTTGSDSDNTVEGPADTDTECSDICLFRFLCLCNSFISVFLRAVGLFHTFCAC